MSDDRIYPCDRCGKLRSKAEGGTIFTVCDACWDALHSGWTDEMLRTLARNLAVAGGLCEAFDQGWESGFDDKHEAGGWHPGCGRPSPSRRESGG